MRLTLRFPSALVAGAVVLCLSAGALFAQAPPRARGRNSAALAPAILAKLNLNDEQKAKIKTAEDAYKAEVEKANALTTPKEKREAGMKARQAYEAAVKDALNDDQKKQLDAMMAEAREFRGMGAMGNRLVGLNLTAEQKTKIKEISAKYQPEIQKLRASLKDATDKQSIQNQIREQNMKMADEVKAVLTPEQQKQIAPAKGNK